MSKPKVYRYAGIIENDFSAAPGITTSIFVQGCPIHCAGCHNQHTWDFDEGKIFTQKDYDRLREAITSNNMVRNLAIMGGEPLCEQNQEFTLYLIEKLKKEIPELKIYLYTGYTLSQLDKNNSNKTILNNIFKHLEWLIAGPFILEKRDITLMYRGSTNQIIYQGPLTFQEKDDIIELNIDEEIKERTRWLQTF